MSCKHMTTGRRGSASCIAMDLPDREGLPEIDLLRAQPGEGRSQGNAGFEDTVKRFHRPLSLATAWAREWTWSFL